MPKISPLVDVFKKSLAIIWERFDLSDDKAQESEVIDSIEKGIELKGTNLWVLIFAIFIASIGLNVNSPAVITGAMLISPLMGPIMGAGLGVGINDFDLIKKALKSLGFAAGVSLLTSTLYFLVSPLSEARPDHLVQITPTIWDVIVAFLGGLAGIIAATRKSKGNVVPGVAIATALMPPLCTAGYGIATGQPYFFLGAFYLFFINSVFICLATYLIVRLLKFKKHRFLDKKLESRVQKYILGFVILTVIPSLFLAYRIVQRSIIETNFNHFVQNEILTFPQTQLIGKTVRYSDGQPEVEVILIGEQLAPNQIAQLETKLSHYRLASSKLIVKQSGGKTSKEDLIALKSGILEDIYRKNEETIKDKDERIRFLENELLSSNSDILPTSDILAELQAQNEDVLSISMARAKTVYKEGTNTAPSDKGQEPILLASIQFKKLPKSLEIQRIRNWLSVRTKTPIVKLSIERTKSR